MYGKVKPLRSAGRRLSDQDIARSHHVEGEVRLAGVAGTLVLSVTPVNSQVADSLLPRLYDARLITMHGTKMLFKGEERPQGDAGPGYVQEWSVVVEDRSKPASNRQKKATARVASFLIRWKIQSFIGNFTMRNF